MTKILIKVSVAMAICSISAATSIALAQKGTGQTAQTQSGKSSAKIAAGKSPRALPNNGDLLNTIKQNGLPGDGSLLRQFQQRMRAQGIEPGSGAILRQMREQQATGKTGAVWKSDKSAILEQIKKQGDLPMDGSLLKQAMQNSGSSPARNKSAGKK
jgi:hypothetical protein